MKTSFFLLFLVKNMDSEPEPIPHQREKWDPDLHQNVPDPTHCVKGINITKFVKFENHYI